MKILDFRNEGTNISSLLFRNADYGKKEESFRIYLHPEKDYSFYLSKGVFDGYHVLYNEFEGGLYLGDEEHPFRYLIKAKDDDVDTLIVHPMCHLIASHAFEKHPTLRRVAFYCEDEAKIAENAFAQCPVLEDIRFLCKKHVLIHYEAYKGNQSLRNVQFNDATYSFNSSAFANCLNLKHIDLPLNLIPHPKFVHPTKVFDGTPVDHVYLPKAMREVYAWFLKETQVYCEEDPSHIATAYEEETVEEPYYDYYHQGGTVTVRKDIRGGENFFGPMSYEEYQNRFPKN